MTLVTDDQEEEDEALQKFAAEALSSLLIRWESSEKGITINRLVDWFPRGTGTCQH